MDWNTIIPITIFISDIFLAWFCYQMGCRTVKPIKLNNAELLQQRKELEDNISFLQEKQQKNKEQNELLNNEKMILSGKVQHLKTEQEHLEKSNKQTQKFISQSEQLAKEKADAMYEKKYSELAHEYQIYKRDLQSIIDRNKNKIQEQENLLKSLQETRAAAITASQQEKHIQENKDFYCLILPPEEAGDVNILRGVAKRISKPRSVLMAIWQAYYQPLAKKQFPKILGKIDVCGIYKITNQETGECYVGQAVDIRKRWYEHAKFMLQIDPPKNNQLYMAAAEYGLDSFSFELLLECKPEELNAKEKYFIELYNSDAVGYNISSGKGN